MQLTPRLAVMLATPPLMWAGNAVIGRIAIDSIGPLWLNALRWVVALALLLPLGWSAVASAAAWRRIGERWRYLAVLGVIGIGGYNALQYMALRTSTPLNVTLIASSSPVWSLVIGALVYRVKPTRMQMLGAALSLTGVATVLSRGDLATLLGIHFVQGDLLILIAIIGWSYYSWLLARPPAHMQGEARPAWGWAEFLIAQSVYGVPSALMVALIGDAVAPPSPAVWSPLLVGIILFVAIGPSVIAYRLWGLAVAEAGPQMAAIFYNLTPLFAAVLSAALIGEWPRIFHGVAFALIVAGISVASRAPSRQG